MKFEDAVQKSIKLFMNGNLPSEMESLAEQGLFYSPDYFDELEDSLLEDAPKKKKEELEDADV